MKNGGTGEPIPPQIHRRSARGRRVRLTSDLSGRGLEQARAIRRASASPSSTSERLGWAWGLRDRAASKPNSTKRSRTRSTVRTPTSIALAICQSAQPVPASAFNRMRAWVRRLAAALPEETRGDGRDHNNKGYTMWMAGGGVKGGLAYGKTDEHGFEAVEGRVHVHDWHATILHLLGLDHEQLTYRHAGRDMRLTDVQGRGRQGDHGVTTPLARS